MRIRTLFYSILSVVLMQAPFRRGYSRHPPAPQTIPIGALVSLSGYDSNLGGQAKAGYELAVEEINSDRWSIC